MKIKKTFLTVVPFFIVLVFLLSACATSTSSPATPSPESPQAGAEQIPDEILQAVANRLGVDPGELQVQEFEQVEWPSACLGLAGPNEMCAEVITPGYRLVVRAGDSQYQVHTDLSGVNLRVAGEEERTALEALAAKLGVERAELEIQVFETVTWPDACLGIPEPDELCAQVESSGYGGILILEGEQYEFRMDESAENIRLIPGAAISARQILASRLAVRVDEVSIVSVQAQDWPDACLGLAEAGQMCAQVITPGYLVVLKANEDLYEYRTDQTGNLVVLAEGPEAQVENPVILWTSADNTECQTAQIGEQVIAAGSCNGPLLPGRFVSRERQNRLIDMAARYASFETETPAGKISFNGQGEILATPRQQRMIAEWAQLAAQEAISGRSGASWGLALTWEREGSIAGFCDRLEVFVYGEAYASSCAPVEAGTVEPVLLNDSQLRQLYQWIDNYAGFEYEQTDPATADAMTIRLIFFGNGNMEGGEAELQAMQEFAAELYAQGTTPQNADDLTAARGALIAYLEHLSAGRFQEAVDYYGGSHEQLAYFNPGIDPTDHAALFEAACTINGMVCLPVRNVVDEAQLSPTEFRITVELENADGGPFTYGPCCGADPAEEPPLTQFLYSIIKSDESFLVQEPPLYVP
jgi:hypothetical protein